MRHGHPVAVGCESVCTGEPDAARSAGDQDHPTVRGLLVVVIAHRHVLHHSISGRGSSPFGGSRSRSCGPSEHGTGGRHAGTETDEQDQVVVAHATGVEGRGESEWNRCDRRVAGSIEDVCGALDQDPQSVERRRDDPNPRRCGTTRAVSSAVTPACARDFVAESTMIKRRAVLRSVRSVMWVSMPGPTTSTFLIAPRDRPVRVAGIDGAGARGVGEDLLRKRRTPACDHRAADSGGCGRHASIGPEPGDGLAKCDAFGVECDVALELAGER